MLQRLRWWLIARLVGRQGYVQGVKFFAGSMEPAQSLWIKMGPFVTFSGVHSSDGSSFPDIASPEPIDDRPCTNQSGGGVK